MLPAVVVTAGIKDPEVCVLIRISVLAMDEDVTSLCHSLVRWCLRERVS
jgi:hypothetical protein